MRVSKVRLARFRLLAYRSCKRTELTPEKEVTALIGTNGSGKTNLLQGLRLLSTTRRRRVNDDDELYTSKCRIESDFIVKKKTVRYRASITYRPTEAAREDVVISAEKWNFEEITGKPEWIGDEELNFLARVSSSGPYFYYRTPGGGRLRLSSDGPWKKGATAKLSKEALAALRAIHEFRSAISYYSASQFTNPSLCPTSFDIDEDGDLLREATVARRQAHTRFIYDLYKLSRDSREAYDAFLSLVDKRGVRLIDRIHWRDVKFSSPAYEVRSGGAVINKRRTRIMIIPTVYVGSAQLSFNQLSEGTLRTLAMLFHITTDKSEMLLIEEPEVCVHHGLLKSVIEVIKEYGRSKQIIFSTHSEAVLDSLTPEDIRLVKRTEERGTEVTTLSKAMSHTGYAALRKYLETTGSLGEFWRHSGFTK